MVKRSFPTTRRLSRTQQSVRPGQARAHLTTLQAQISALEAQLATQRTLQSATSTVRLNTLLTIYDTLGLRSRMGALGIRYYLAKPVEVVELERVVRDMLHLESRAARSEGADMKRTTTVGLQAHQCDG